MCCKEHAIYKTKPLEISLKFDLLLRCENNPCFCVCLFPPPPPPPLKGGRGFLMSPPLAVSLIQLFFISSFVLLPSPVGLSVLSFSAFAVLAHCFWHLTSISLNLHFPKGRLFCVVQGVVVF